MNIISDEAFRWFLTVLTGGVSGAWVVYDAINLGRMRRADRRNAIVRDKQFGYAMGVIIGTIGVIGALRFHQVL
jgi:hypothetical protein